MGIIMYKLKKIIKSILPYSIVIFIHRYKSKHDEIKNRLTLAESYDKDNFRVRKDTFDNIYKTNYWSSNESYSGKGSQINTTINIRKALPKLFKKYKIKTLLDVPCGDFNWMKEVDKTNIEYIGGDIVEEIVVNNNKKWGGGGGGAKNFIF
jgi:hypothetical protein